MVKRVGVLYQTSQWETMCKDDFQHEVNYEGLDDSVEAMAVGDWNNAKSVMDGTTMQRVKL